MTLKITHSCIHISPFLRLVVLILLPGQSRRSTNLTTPHDTLHRHSSSRRARPMKSKSIRQHPCANHYLLCYLLLFSLVLVVVVLSAPFFARCLKHTQLRLRNLRGLDCPSKIITGRRIQLQLCASSILSRQNLLCPSPRNPPPAYSLNVKSLVGPVVRQGWDICLDYVTLSSLSW